MRKLNLALGAAALASAVATGCQSRDAGAASVDESLARDLALAEAGSTSLTLPGTPRARTQVVSAVELTGATPRPVERAAPRPRRAVKRSMAEPAVRPAVVEPAVLVAETVAAEAATDADAPPAIGPAAAETPATEIVAAGGEASDAPGDVSSGAEPVIENPRPVPAGRSAPPERDGGWGGVVIRGGRVDGDHCERHRRGRGGPLISVTVRGPIGNPTFPRMPGMPRFPRF